MTDNPLDKLHALQHKIYISGAFGTTLLFTALGVNFAMDLSLRRTVTPRTVSQMWVANILESIQANQDSIRTYQERMVQDHKEIISDLRFLIQSDSLQAAGKSRR